MARNGKIAHLSRELRHQLNTRLADGVEGRDILPWLNALPETKAVLAEKFASRPITEQNLSEWRQGGYEEWLVEQNLSEHVRDLAAHTQELQSIVPGQSLADHLAVSVAFRLAALLSAPGVNFDEATIAQLRALVKTSQAVVKLRRSDQNAARLKIETERWELARPNTAAENAEKLKRLQRDILAAPVLAAVKSIEQVEKFGAGPAGRWAIDYLREIETCPDPAHFQSKTLSLETIATLQSQAEAKGKNPLTNFTDVEAALQMISQIDRALGKNGEIKPTSTRKKHPSRHPHAPKSKKRSPRLATSIATLPNSIDSSPSANNESFQPNQT